MNNHNNVIIYGLYPGAGKSFASQLCSKKALYVTPFNQLCQELIIKGHTAVTLHNLMALNITGNSSKRKQYDVSEFDTIVFEEILLYNPKLLSSIHRFMKMHKDKKIIANGDISQNLPILFDLNNVSSQEKYVMNCINIMFNNQIILKVNKRLENKEDRDMLAKLKDDIFDLNKDVIDTFKKYNFNIISNLNDIQTTKNISYFKSRSYKINNFVQNKLIKVPHNNIEYEYECNNKMYRLKYYVGQRVICRQSFKRKNTRLYTNYIYEILNIEDDENDEENEYIISLKNINDEEIMTIKYDHLKYISLPYSNTCHSSQGTTIYEPYTIFDSNIVYCDRRWIWTALTRTTCLKNISIFEHSKNECQVLEKCKYRQYYELKIKNYIIQDEIAGRIKTSIKEIEEEDEYTNGIIKTKTKEYLFKNDVITDYIDYQWIIKQQFKCCICDEHFDIEIEDSKVTSNMTVDRKDNTLYHSKSNCQLACLNCNRAKK